MSLESRMQIGYTHKVGNLRWVFYYNFFNLYVMVTFLKKTITHKHSPYSIGS